MPGCGCGCSDAAPCGHDNPPGEPALRLRLGTRADFLDSMVARFHSEDVATPGGAVHPLRALSTRAGDDLSIALLDAWACALDVLAFYQERIGNEGFLRTATERRSVLELARSIGYELRPGLAAEALLAFSMDAADPTLPSTTAPRGTRVRSIPGPGESAQTFETAEELVLRPEWNAMRARSEVPQPIRKGVATLRLRGLATGLQAGDALVVVGAERLAKKESNQWDLRYAASVTLDAAAQQTAVALDRPLGSSSPHQHPTHREPKVYALRQRAALFGHNAPDWRALPQAMRDGYGLSKAERAGSQWPRFDLPSPGPEGPLIDLDAAYPKVVAGSWVALQVPYAPRAPSGEREHYAGLYQVRHANTAAATGFTLACKTTRLQLDTGTDFDHFLDRRRDTLVLGHSEPLEFGTVAVRDPVAGSRVTLDRTVHALERGRRLLVTGKRFRARLAEGRPRDAADVVLTDRAGKTRKVALEATFEVLRHRPADAAHPKEAWSLLAEDGFAGDAELDPGHIERFPALPDPAPGAPRPPPGQSQARLCEPAVVRACSDKDGVTLVDLADPLENEYDPATVTVHGNVARATHGETVREVLGSGDAATPHQRFSLSRAPLTHVAAVAAGGAEAAIEVRVGPVAWTPVDTLYGQPPDAHVYAVRRRHDGGSDVVFGDGRFGSRLPTGGANVTAAYRAGLGPEGHVAAGRIALLHDRPHGVTGVSNPLASAGGQSPEPLEEARGNAPRTVLTLDRVVSFQDHEDFARAFAGVGKAKATRVTLGERVLVHLTVAPPDGGGALTQEQLGNLVRSIRRAGDPHADVRATGHRAPRFRLDARLTAAAGYDPEAVAKAAWAHLRASFAFERRAFGQAVTAAELMRMLHKVEGVDAVAIRSLRRDPAPGADPGGAGAQRLEALLAEVAGGDLLGAELLVLDEPGSMLQVVLP